MLKVTVRVPFFVQRFYPAILPRGREACRQVCVWAKRALTSKGQKTTPKEEPNHYVPEKLETQRLKV